MIDKFSGKYEFLSNFYECNLEFGGIQYNHSEGAFQAQKTFDIGTRHYVSRLKPGQSKRYCGAKGSLILRSDWEKIKDEVMLEVVRAKFKQNEDLKDKLLATGDEELIEGTTWHDNYWGNCICSKCKNIEGKNTLGKILMRVRSELRNES